MRTMSPLTGRSPGEYLRLRPMFVAPGSGVVYSMAIVINGQANVLGWRCRAGDSAPLRSTLASCASCRRSGWSTSWICCPA